MLISVTSLLYFHHYLSQDVLPSSFRYVILDKDSINGDSGKWKCSIRAAIENKVEALNWLSEYESLNDLDFRVLKTKKENTDRLVFKVPHSSHAFHEI